MKKIPMVVILMQWVIDMKYYWYKLLYALKFKERPIPLTCAELINVALTKIDGDEPNKIASDIEKQRGIKALNIMMSQWGISNGN